MEIPPEVILLEPREVYDRALVGLTVNPSDHWPRKEGITVAVYDVDKCIDATKEAWGWSEEAAVEWFDYNTAGVWVGERTPTFVYSDPDADLAE